MVVPHKSTKTRGSEEGGGAHPVRAVQIERALEEEELRVHLAPLVEGAFQLSLCRHGNPPRRRE